MSYAFKMIEGFGVYKWTIDFERSLDNSVLFTNVTGGEWKNIRNPRTESVLHIPRQVDKRADLIVILRQLGVILITEAKDDIKKLKGDLRTHSQVIKNLTSVFSKVQHGVWNSEESGSTIVPALLWCKGPGMRATGIQVTGLFYEFEWILKQSSYTGPEIMVGLEVIKDERQHLSTRGYVFFREAWKRKASEIANLLSEVTGNKSLFWNLNLHS